MNTIAIILIVIYGFSFIGVCVTFDKRDVEPSVLAFIILGLPIINTLYVIIYGDFFGGHDNIYKMFNKNIKKK